MLQFSSAYHSHLPNSFLHLKANANENMQNCEVGPHDSFGALFYRKNWPFSSSYMLLPLHLCHFRNVSYILAIYQSIYCSMPWYVRPFHAGCCLTRSVFQHLKLLLSLVWLSPGTSIFALHDVNLLVSWYNLPSSHFPQWFAHLSLFTFCRLTSFVNHCIYI